MSSFRDYLRQIDPSFLRENYDPEDARIVHLYHFSPRINDIKQEAGISAGHLYRVLRRNGVNPYRRQKSRRETVMYYFNAGLSLTEIAKLTDYTVRQIRNIIKESNV